MLSPYLSTKRPPATPSSWSATLAQALASFFSLVPSGASAVPAQILTMLPQVPAGTLIQAPTILSSLALPWQEMPNDLEAQVFLPPLTMSAQRSLFAAEATLGAAINAAANTEVATAEPNDFCECSMIFLVFIVCSRVCKKWLVVINYAHPSRSPSVHSVTDRTSLGVTQAYCVQCYTPKRTRCLPKPYKKMQEFVSGSGVYTVDALYYQPELAAIHIVREGDEIAIIDTGTQFSVPQISSALDQLQLDFSAVKYIILTHIHLDHAGGAGALMALCENATLVVHERGARHMAEPAKLIAGAQAVYGEREFARLYGEILPIDPARIISPGDGEQLSMGKRVFEFIDTPGHANHHFCIIDRSTNSIFTGDTVGVAYQALREADHAFVMPTTTPVQFNPQALHASIDKVMSNLPDWLYCTHYSAYQPSTRIIAGLHEQIDDLCRLTEAASQSGEKMTEDLANRIRDYAITRATNELPSFDQATIAQWVELDSTLNAQGLAFWWQHRRAA